MATREKTLSRVFKNVASKPRGGRNKAGGLRSSFSPPCQLRVAKNLPEGGGRDRMTIFARSGVHGEAVALRIGSVRFAGQRRCNPGGRCVRCRKGQRPCAQGRA